MLDRGHDKTGVNWWTGHRSCCPIQLRFSLWPRPAPAQSLARRPLSGGRIRLFGSSIVSLNGRLGASGGSPSAESRRRKPGAKRQSDRRRRSRQRSLVPSPQPLTLRSPLPETILEQRPGVWLKELPRPSCNKLPTATGPSIEGETTRGEPERDQPLPRARANTTPPRGAP